MQKGPIFRALDFLGEPILPMDVIFIMWKVYKFGIFSDFYFLAFGLITDGLLEMEDRI